MDTLTCKIIDVDFKNKKRNFSFETKTNKKNIERVQSNLSSALIDIQKICSDDKVYYDWCLSMFYNIVVNLKGRE